MKNALDWVLPAVGGAVLGGVFVALIKPEAPSAVIWTGPMDTRMDAVIAALGNAGFTISSGRLKQEVTDPYSTWQAKTSTLLVKPSEAGDAKQVVQKAVAQLPSGPVPMGAAPR